MPEPYLKLAVCIPTFRRPRLLALLLDDMTRQTLVPQRLIVVDGEPSSGEVEAVLAGISTRIGAGVEILYVPSNHANLPYQRFLGWKAAAGARWLLYLDDDLRLLRPDSVERLILPLRASRGRVVGTTAEFESSPQPAKTTAASRAMVAPPTGRAWTRLAQLFGASRGRPPGGLSPSGHRLPLPGRGKPYEVVACLRGGAMAYRMSAITADCFSDALFAMAQRGWGLGEDTLLSRRISRRTSARAILLTAFGSGIAHPGDHATVAYRRGGFGRGFATAYSRRLLNDHYRAFAAPALPVRLALARSYAANAILAWSRAIRAADRQACAFASGYSLGSLRGLLQKPTSRRLTPGIDWWAEADAALAQLRPLEASPSWPR